MKQTLHSIVFIGAGNVATHLAQAFTRCGCLVCQIFSRTEDSARELAGQIGCPYTTSTDYIISGADLYIVAVKDAVLGQLIPQITARSPQSLFVHTAGSMPMSVFEGRAERYGVLYPLQTFSKEREVDFRRIPFFLEAARAEDGRILEGIARRLSDDVRFLPSEKRRSLHLAAVFACNFANHMYALAERVLQEEGIPGEVLLPLIDETAAKVHHLSPREAQTGPAVRYDENVIARHLALLRDPATRDLYERISASIHKSYE